MKKKSILYRKVVATAVFIIMSIAATASDIRNMQVEYEREPIGLDVERPRFSWQMATDEKRRGQRQKAWQIVVCDESGRQVWDSGRRETDLSVGMVYEGERLQPTTQYTWKLTVWDERGKTATAASRFETGLMADGGWSGAQWIGSDTGELPLYAHYLPVFRLSFTVQANGKAAFVYGANDPRLMDINKNILGVKAGHDEAYVKVELDLASDTARLNIYRAGYSKEDRRDVPLKSLIIPTELINRSNRTAAHTVSLSSVLGTTRFFIDGSDKAIGTAELNPMGRGGDFIAFPMLGDYGFTVGKGQTARFTNVSVSNYRSPKNVIKTLVADTVVTSNDVRTRSIDGRSEPMLRTVFAIGKRVKKARLYVTARGVYQCLINGRRVGKDYLNPGLSQYNRTHFYQTYDVTPLLRQGANAFGAQLAEGWWSGGVTFVGDNWNAFGDTRSLLAKLVVTYDDGTTEAIVTNPQTWQVCDKGPLRSGSLFQGEVYDGELDAAFNGWTTANYDASRWTAASVVPLAGRVSDTGNGDMPAPNDYSQYRLTAQTGTTVQAVDTLTAQSVEEVRPGVFVYDMGQNMAGVPLIKLDGLTKGTKLTLRYAEVKYPALPQYADNQGMIMLENIRAAMAQDVYVARGGKETFSPQFTYHGYRYVEITGIGSPLPKECVQGVVLSSVHDFTADYTTSDNDVNKLWKNITWSMRANFMSVPTDCPQRNERMGWSGDISVFSPTATYMANVDGFLARHTQAMRDVQRADGKFLDIAPIGGGFGGVLWGSAGIIVPWQCWLQYADRAVLADNYDAMCRYIDYVQRKTIDPATGLIVQRRAWGDLADWLGPEDGRNDKSLLWEAYYIHDLDIMAKTANALGKTTDAERFANMAAERRAFFNRTYIQAGTAKTVWSAFNEKKKGKIVDTQTSYVLPLAFDIVADSIRSRFVDNLAATVTRQNGNYPPYSLLTGFIGTAWVSKALSDCGHTDLAYRMLLQRDYPSWLYSITQGATTIWERLNSYTHKDGFGTNNRMNSFNHYSFGAVGEWMISHSLGIRRDEASPAFKHFTLSPEFDPTGNIHSASGHYDSMYGRIESSWRRDGDRVIYEFTIPANTSATVLLPNAKAKEYKSGRYTVHGKRQR